MSARPSRSKIYHITHVANLGAIVGDGALLSDAAMSSRGGPETAIGLSTIKRRRLEDIEVTPYPGTRVGEYVPFNFCPRSVMLYVIHRANHPELSFRGGQESVVHLEADLDRVLCWASETRRKWSFSFSNAGARYTRFGAQPDELDHLDWDAIAALDFRDRDVSEHKQAEFLVHESFPLGLVERIGVYSATGPAPGMGGVVPGM